MQRPLSNLSVELKKPTQRKGKFTYFVTIPRITETRPSRSTLIRHEWSCIFLPPYSPNLNPIERLWKWMEERVIYNAYYEHFEEFRAAVLGFFAVLSTAKEESKR